ncbi:MAG: hypothetical protein PGN29_16545 [Gordonia paraffinivorans]
MTDTLDAPAQVAATRTGRRTVAIGQFRLTRIQLVNWGTFHGYKDFPIDERGVLLTGPSGSGKSSLMDGHSVVLLPTYDQGFNASADLTAKGAKRAARSMADYVRGAWAENDDEYNQSQVQYLRGSGATWSAIAATYDNGAGSVTTAVAIKWFPGSGNDGASLRSWYQLHSGEMDLIELNDWAAGGFDIRAYRASHPDVACFDVQSAYSEALRRRVGIGASSAALSLMGKAKAMKNVGDLNLFIRTYMLDRPDTYAKAQRLIENFTQLDEAYQAAARAHAQEKVLRPIPEAWEAYQGAERSTTRAGDLLGPPMRAFMREHPRGPVARQARRDRGSAHRPRQRGRVMGERRRRPRGPAHVAARSADRRQGRADDARVRVEGVRAADHRAEPRVRAVRGGGRTAGGGDPHHPQTSSPPCGTAHLHWAAPPRKPPSRCPGGAHAVFTAESDARREHDAVVDELTTLTARRSLLPAGALAQRDAIAAGTGLAPHDLPYAAELMEVAPRTPGPVGGRPRSASCGGSD